jgi:hypothetical protein
MKIVTSDVSIRIEPTWIQVIYQARVIATFSLENNNSETLVAGLRDAADHLEKHFRRLIAQPGEYR